VRALKRNGAKFSVADNAGDNGLHCLARCNRVDLLNLREDADWRRAVRGANAAGATPLHTLLQGPVREASEEILAALMHCGADSSLADHSGQTPMDLAVVRLPRAWLWCCVHESMRSSALRGPAPPRGAT
jgi:ankyrin repeat protein